MSDLTTRPYFETFVMDDEHPDGRAGFVCSECRIPVDEAPCATHAPRGVPGLALVECEADRRHWAWVLASDANGYGVPCYACIVDEWAADLRRAKDTRDRRWLRRWRYWTAARRAARLARIVGAIGGYALESSSYGWRLCSLSLRGRRDYILGVRRETWRCLLIGRHRRGDEVGFGYCGKCVPWSCCGSQRAAHNAGCPEDR